MVEASKPAAPAASAPAKKQQVAAKPEPTTPPPTTKPQSASQKVPQAPAAANNENGVPHPPESVPTPVTPDAPNGVKKETEGAPSPVEPQTPGDESIEILEEEPVVDDEALTESTPPPPPTAVVEVDEVEKEEDEVAAVEETEPVVEKEVDEEADKGEGDEGKNVATEDLPKEAVKAPASAPRLSVSTASPARPPTTPKMQSTSSLNSERRKMFENFGSPNATSSSRVAADFKVIGKLSDRTRRSWASGWL